MIKALLAIWMCTAVSVAAAAETETSPRLALELTDGSQLLGVAAVESVKVHLPDSVTQFALREITHIELHPDHEHVTVHMREGGEVTGVLEADVFSLSAAFQPSSVTHGTIQALKVLAPIPHVDWDDLQPVVRGTIQEWKPDTGEITILYDFDSLAELQDWEGGSINSDGQLDANRRHLQLTVPFESVHHVGYDGFYYSGYGRITMYVGGLTAEFGGHGGRHLIFQASWRNPVAHVSGGVSPGRTYSASLDFSREGVRWSWNDEQLLDALLQRPLTSPVQLIVVHPYSHTAYDNVTVSGVIDPRLLQNIVSAQ